VSVTGARTLRKLLRQILKDNRAVFSLKGGNNERGAAITKALNLLSRMAGSGGRAYEKRYELNRLVADLRSVASERRLPAAIRVKSCLRLSVVEGISPVTELGTDDVDDQIKRLIANRPVPPTEAQTPTTASTPKVAGESFEAMMARIRAKSETGGNDVDSHS
jgi:hypothetical protein